MTLKLLCASSLLALSGVTPSLAQAAIKHHVEIPSQDLRSALTALARQTKIQLIYSAPLVDGLSAKALNGSMTPEEALRVLLEPNHLRFEFLDAKTVTVLQAAGAGASLPFSRDNIGSKRYTTQETRVAWLDDTVPTEQSSTDRAVSNTQDVPADTATSSVDTVVVTGSHIRGGETPSPVLIIDAQQIKEQGFTDLGEVIRSIPQNFSGGQNPGIVGAVGNVINQNLTGGSGLNLRGLGPDATLTLLNGRRMSYDGQYQSVDISSIPVTAVERLEIVADGASAIYGSDAVGGVGNVILKRDFDGVALGARYGAATDGGLATREYEATAGTTWSSGGFIATYKDVSTDPIYKDQRDYTRNMYAPYTIYPGSELRSGLLSAHQSVGDSVELRLVAFRTERDQLSYSSNPSYYLYTTPQTETWSVSPSLEVALPGAWTLSLGASLGESKTVANYVMETYATATSTLIQTCVCNKSSSYDASVEGPLFALGGGDARLAVGVGYRTNDYLLNRNLIGNSARFGAAESGRFAYAELNLPLVGADSNIAGVHKLALTAALRGEDYDTFGGVTTPKLGLVYGPNADVTLKASWGKSFKAPTLDQRSTTSYAFLDPANWYGNYPSSANVLYISGGNPDLGPERARTWTASLAFHPESVSGLEVELTGFKIDYTDRVVYPVTYSSIDVLSNPSNAPYVLFSPSAEQQAAAIASIGTNYAGTGFDPDSVMAILFGRYTNAALQEIKGVDLSAAYGFDLGAGRLTLRGAVSWLNSSQQTTAGQANFDLAGYRGSPAEINSRIGAVWITGGFTAGTFVSYVDGVTIGAATASSVQTTASFTTVDATLRYDSSGHGGVWSGLEFALSAQNLFDRAPPLYQASSVNAIRYDSTNYSAIGRFLSVSVAKHW